MMRLRTCALLARRGRLALLLTAAMVSFAGCGGDRVAVRGQVWLDDEPLPRGVIKFVPLAGVDGPQVAADIIDGEYEFDSMSGPVTGEHRVEIFVDQPLTPGMDDPEEYIRLGGPQGLVREPQNGVAPQFNSASTLVAQPSHDGGGAFDFHVTSVPSSVSP